MKKQTIYSKKTKFCPQCKNDVSIGLFNKYLCKECSKQYAFCKGCSLIKDKIFFSNHNRYCNGKCFNEYNTKRSEIASFYRKTYKACDLCGTEYLLKDYPKKKDLCKNCIKTHRKCRGCEIILQINDKNFYKQRSKCKKCEKIRAKKYDKENKEIRIERRKSRYIPRSEMTEDERDLKRAQDREYREENKEYFKEKRKGYRNNNKEKVKERNKKNWAENKEQIKAKRKTERAQINAYKRRKYAENKEEINAKRREERPLKRDEINARKRKSRLKKIEQDPIGFKLRGNFSRIIRESLFKNGGSKNNKSIMNFISYNIQELKQYLELLFESWMNWNNYGIYDSKYWDENDSSTWKWSLDHIIPQSILPYSSMEDLNFKICWDIKNLKPLSTKENAIKNNKLTDEAKKLLKILTKKHSKE